MKQIPNVTEWMKEAKSSIDHEKIGMFLMHNGVVRQTAKDKVRNGNMDAKDVTGMDFSYDETMVEKAIESTKQLPGIYYVRVWLNEGHLDVGDDIMYVLIGGDIRPHVLDGLNYLVGTIKQTCVIEKEITD